MPPGTRGAWEGEAAGKEGTWIQISQAWITCEVGRAERAEWLPSSEVIGSCPSLLSPCDSETMVSVLPHSRFNGHQRAKPGQFPPHQEATESEGQGRPLETLVWGVSRDSTPHPIDNAESPWQGQNNSPHVA